MSDQEHARTSDRTLVFLLDVDNTLLDNDRLKADIDRDLRGLIGAERTERFWEIYEQVRHEQDYVDYPRTVELWTEEYGDLEAGGRVQHFLDTLPFKEYVYPHAFETLAHFRTMGAPVILSDGDQVFQRRKIRQSGLEEAVEGRVLIYVHKEEHLPEVFARYPADHYVVVDDKPRILSALERECPTEFTTILVEQGKYAREVGSTPLPDLEAPSIGDLRHFTREQMLQPRGRAASKMP